MGPLISFYYIKLFCYSNYGRNFQEYVDYLLNYKKMRIYIQKGGKQENPRWKEPVGKLTNQNIIPLGNSKFNLGLSNEFSHILLQKNLYHCLRMKSSIFNYLLISSMRNFKRKHLLFLKNRLYFTINLFYYKYGPFISNIHYFLMLFC